MKKIYFIDEGLDRMGGVERVVSTLSNNLAEKYDVELISIYKSRKQPHFKYDEKIKINYIYDKTNLFSKRFKKVRPLYLSIRFFEIIIEKIIRRVSVSKYCKRITENDVVVFGRVPTALEFLPYISKTKKTIVREAIHLHYHKDKKKIKKHFPSKVDLFIISSEENRQTYDEFFEGKVKMIKIYNPLGINPTKIKNINSKVVISVGRYDSHKGYDCLIKSWSYVYKKHPDWILRIVGDGYYKPQMIKLIQNYNLENVIQLIPSTNNIVDELCNSSIFVSSSRFEGYANALVEAMACGLACISYNWMMGVNEIITNGKNGLVVPLSDRIKYMNSNYADEKDIKNMAEAIINLIKNKDMRLKFSNKSILLN